MYRFFVNQKIDNYFVLPFETLNHMKVLRIDFKVKPFYCIFQSEVYKCLLEENKAKILAKEEINNEFKNEVILAVGLIENKHWEWLIQKATELGVSQIFPLISQNYSKKDTLFSNAKLLRWNKIVSSAAEQSFRNKIPIIHHPYNFKTFLDLKINDEITNKFLAHNDEKIFKPELKASFSSPIIFLVGPEGGFSNEEALLAQKRGFNVLLLGQRILRTETACLFLLSRIWE